MSGPSTNRVEEGAHPRVGVVIPAAGLSSRMGGTRKQFLSLAGEPVLLRSMRPFLECPSVRAVVVALPSDDLEQTPSWLTGVDPRVHLVEGGRTRRDSVWAGLCALPTDLDVILVHDGARPLVSAPVITRCIDAALEGVGAVAGFQAVDTLKLVDENRRVTSTPERSSLWHAQTPQAFPAGLLLDAYRIAVAEDWPATDDASLVERNGGCVVMVESPATNLKITRPADLELAASILAGATG